MTTTITVCFQMRPRSTLGRVVKLVAGAPTHCWLEIGSTDQYAREPFVVEADAPQGVSCGYRFGPTTDIVRLRVEAPFSHDAVMAQIDQIAAAEHGCRYDYVGAVIGWTIGHQHDDKWFCSELVAHTLTLLGVILARSNPAEYTPRRLYRELREHIRADASLTRRMGAL